MIAVLGIAPVVTWSKEPLRLADSVHTTVLVQMCPTTCHLTSHGVIPSYFRPRMSPYSAM